MKKFGSAGFQFPDNARFFGVLCIKFEKLQRVQILSLFDETLFEQLVFLL